MNRTTISLTPELQEKLRLEAAKRGVSMATLIRESVEGLQDHERPEESKGKSVRNRGDSTAGEAEVINEGNMSRVIEALPADTKKRVLQAAKERGTTPERFVLFAIEDKAAFVRPKPKSIGKYSSGFTDTAFRAGEEPAVPQPWR